jgi:hypothetical protein
MFLCLCAFRNAPIAGHKKSIVSKHHKRNAIFLLNRHQFLVVSCQERMDLRDCVDRWAAFLLMQIAKIEGVEMSLHRAPPPKNVGRLIYEYVDRLRYIC